MICNVKLHEGDVVPAGLAGDARLRDNVNSGNKGKNL